MSNVIIPVTELAYDYPDGGLDPFDVEEPRTQHVFEARGWARAWVPGDDSVGWGRRIGEAIPVGYRYLAKLEKLAVVVAGGVVREWPAAADPYAHRRQVAFERGFSGGGILDEATIDAYWANDQPWLRSTYPYRVQAQTLDLPGEHGDMYGFHTYDEAIAGARELGISTPLLVSRVLSHQSWH